MKRTLYIVIAITALAISAFADIPGPSKKPKPTPVDMNKEIEKMNAKSAVHEGSMRIYFDDKQDVPVLELRRSAIEKLVASNGEMVLDNVADSRPAITSTQTIVSGVLFSLAFVVGGIWIIRSKGASRTAAGVVLGTLVGAATMALANSPPPRVVTITSQIFASSTQAYGYATNRVKIRLIDEKDPVRTPREDVLLIVPERK